MKITKLTLDDKDIKEAVQSFLKTKGIDMPVHSVSKEYTWSKEMVVTFEFEVEPEAAPPLPMPTETSIPTSANTIQP